jgi:DNA-binding XRE family transcriptional regulator
MATRSRGSISAGNEAVLKYPVLSATLHFTAMEQFLSEDAFLKAFQQRLASARRERGFTQLQLAVALGLALATFKKYETRSAFPMYLLPKLSVLLDKPLSYWIFGQNTPPRKSRRQ